jgi:hypothetical protein
VQEPQFSPFDSENLTPAERRTVRRVRARRLKAFSLSIGVSVLALFAVGCPEAADLANPENYPTGPSGGTGGGATAGTGTGGMTSPSACETDCIKDIFQKQVALCKVCHAAMGLQSSGLNLESDGFTDRLKNVPAKHGDLPMGKADCKAGDSLIDTANPSASWLLKKIQGNQGNCGDPMPPGSLSAAQKTCMETYIACVAGGSIAGGGGGTANGGTSAGGTATGGASAGTSSGGSGGKGGSGGTSGGSGGRGGSGGTGGRGGSGGTGGRGGSGGTGGRGGSGGMGGT